MYLSSFYLPGGLSCATTACKFSVKRKTQRFFPNNWQSLHYQLLLTWNKNCFKNDYRKDNESCHVKKKLFSTYVLFVTVCFSPQASARKWKIKCSACLSLNYTWPIFLFIALCMHMALSVSVCMVKRSYKERKIQTMTQLLQLPSSWLQNRLVCYPHITSERDARLHNCVAKTCK